MSRKRLIGAIAVCAVAVLPFSPASADHCEETVTVVGPTYLVDRPEGDPVDWVYLESNDVPGLQSGGYHGWDVQGMFNQDPCYHANPDTLLY